MLNGIDISHWQGSTPSLSGLSFCAIQTCYGTHKDVMFDTHYANSRKASLFTIGYLFGVNADPIAQANALLAIGKDCDLLALDQEMEKNIVPMSDAQAASVISHVKAAGRKIVLYHQLSGFPKLGQDYNWIADWALSPPPKPWAIWQYKGSTASDLIDRDYFDGTVAQLWALGEQQMKLPYTPAAQIGTATVTIDGAAAFNSDNNIYPVARYRTLPVYGSGTLTVPVNAANAVNKNVYITAIALASGAVATQYYVLQNNVTYVPNPVATSVTPVDATSCKAFSDAAYLKGISDEEQHIKDVLGLA